MASELEQLRERVTQLQAEKDALLQQSNGADGSSPSGSTASDSARPERIFYLPREKKCPLFRGPHGISVDDWVEEVRASMRARHLVTLQDQAYFILDHLEGEAKDEIKYRPRTERENPESIFTILTDLYGCSKPYVSLQEDFFSRKQLEGESFQEFSHALYCLMDKVVARAPRASVPNSAILLRDQFVENVSDATLRRELKRLARDKPECSLLDVRTEAIRWEREGRPNVAENRFDIPALCATQNSRAQTHYTSPPMTSQLEKLTAMLEKQQQQIDQLSQSMQQLQAPPRHSRFTRPTSITCRRCQQPGHYAKDCDNERVPAQSRNFTHVPQVRATTTSQQAEN